MTPQAAAVLALREDFELYAPAALKVKNKAGEIVPFVLNRAQEHIHQAIEHQKATTGRVRAMILKGRQQGASTYIGGRFYWLTSGEFGKSTFILTHEQAATDNLFDMTKRFHDNCRADLKPQTAADNAKELWFNKLDSRYKVATAGAKATGRSATAQFFHGSEMAFWPNAADHMAGIGQTVPNEDGTEIVLESTGNGIGNPFHQMWVRAVRGESEYLPIFVPWFWEEGYRREVPAGFVLNADEAKYMAAYDLDLEQMAWRRAKINDDFAGDVSLFNQEYPATADMAFMRGAERALISMELVSLARKPKKMEDRGARILGVDPAEYGRDKSALVLRVGRQVPWVKRYAKKGTMELAGLVAKEYDDAVAAGEPFDAIIVDVTGVGTGVADRLIEMQIPHVYRVHFGGKAYEDTKYLNRRAECWGRGLDWLKDDPCLLPEDDQLQSDLASVPYHYDSSRRLVLMSKEKMHELGIPSPDSGDAWALTFAENISPRTVAPKGWRTKLATMSGNTGSALGT
jgi:hypothetical protein